MQRGVSTVRDYFLTAVTISAFTCADRRMLYAVEEPPPTLFMESVSRNPT